MKILHPKPFRKIVFSSPFSIRFKDLRLGLQPILIKRIFFIFKLSHLQSKLVLSKGKQQVCTLDVPYSMDLFLRTEVLIVNNAA